MTVIVKIARRVPRNWFKRTAYKFKGLMTFQENIWLIIERSMTIAKKKATASNSGIIFTKQTYREPEDINFDLEWIEVTIEGNPMQEQEEYEEAMGMYKSLKQLFKSELPKDDAFTKPFKTTRLTEKQLEQAYKAGYGNVGEDTISQKLLELGIMTYIEKIERKA